MIIITDLGINYMYSFALASTALWVNDILLYFSWSSQHAPDHIFSGHELSSSRLPGHTSILHGDQADSPLAGNPRTNDCTLCVSQVSVFTPRADVPVVFKVQSSSTCFGLRSWALIVKLLSGEVNSQNIFDDKSTSIQVMSWCCPATSHYLGRCVVLWVKNTYNL